ncbi:MAG: MgtC/SapB family protein [Gammaproteobacteria bacterium]|nr:MgtC/SapB family protein [Gammaproteobacteria bacterium]
MQALFDIDPFNWPAIVTALLCGTIIGLERQLRGKPVGIRTSALIVLGTYVFVKSASTLVGNVDAGRVIGQVITGIGFLGAGVMLAREGIVVGVTSASAIWALASIGVTIGLGYHLTAIKLSFVVIFILLGVDLLEDYSAAFTRGVHAKIRDWRGRGIQPRQE